ncbi:MAG: VacJ family lipoprotein, partial [Verrucomicrobiaceae bacterium]|nr:VacJ family lipoprotein [Verrucomicrobiaceae bacterium]
AFENVKFPVRFVNSALQGKFKRAGKETGKFFVNTIFGVGGLFKTSDKIPDLTDVPAEDTGQTLAKWRIPHGPYIVLPFFGPCTLRETVGMAGDYALNPVNWGIFWHGGHDWEHDWTAVPPASNTLRSMPDQLSKYDAATENSVDPYVSARSTYIQNRAASAKD